MKKLNIALTAILTGIVLISCGQKAGKYPGYEKVEENLYVQYHENNDTGRVVQAGDIVSMSMVYTTEDDSVLMDSRASGQTVQLQISEGAYQGDIMGAFIGMNAGDSVALIVSADSFFLKTAKMPELPDFIKPSSVLKFNVKLKEVQSMEELQAAQQKAQEGQRSAEAAKRQAYLEENNITETPTESGLIYISKKKGTGKQAEAGKVVKVHYEGKLLDGTYFDTSVKEAAQEAGLYDERREPYAPFEFTLGQGQVIPGWDEGIAMMKEGGKATLIIPSDLAYGANPRPGGPIKPFSTLVFDVELIEVSEAGE